MDNRRVSTVRAVGEEEPEDLLRLERAGGGPALLPEGDLPPLISSHQVGLGQVKLARFPLMTGTRGLPYRTIPGALYNFFLGRLVDGLVSIMQLGSSQVRLRGERKGRDLRARQRERVQKSRALEVCSDLKTQNWQIFSTEKVKFDQICPSCSMNATAAGLGKVA